MHSAITASACSSSTALRSCSVIYKHAIVHCNLSYLKYIVVYLLIACHISLYLLLLLVVYTSASALIVSREPTSALDTHAIISAVIH
jgi:hypothetical protein